MHQKFYFTLLLLLITQLSFSQNVSTLISQPGTRFEAITWAPNGDIYTSDYTNGKVYKLNGQGDIQQIGDYSSTLGGGMDAAGNFYISEFNAGQIIKFDTADNASVYTSGLLGPAGILIDDVNQIMYVANYSGNRISKIDMTAANPTPTTLASGGLINGPDGLVFSPEGDLISANFNNNSVQRITPEGEVTRFATLTGSQNSGYLVLREDRYIITGAGTPKIFQMALDGTVRPYAGRGGIGGANGTLNESTFDLPNGIALSPSGDSLVIAESTTAGRIRLITGLGEITNIEDLNFIQQVNVYPNPTSDFLQIELTLEQPDSLRIQLLDMTGKQLGVLLKQDKASGQISAQVALPRAITAGTYL
ncbi:MAG: SMP-30/gluconolactonase/LRE family protein, partial [Saprospiraceae bacterium]